MNKHGFVGVRKRYDYSHRRKPYYTRIGIDTDLYEYSGYFATAEEAAAEYQRIKHRLMNPCGKIAPLPTARGNAAVSVDARLRTRRLVPFIGLLRS